MKKWMLVLCALVAILIAFLALRHFGLFGNTEIQHAARTVSTSVAVPKPAPKPLPKQTQKPITEQTPPALESGDPVMVNGQSLATVLQNGVQYVSVEEFSNALKMSCILENGTAELKGMEEIRFKDGKSKVFFDKRKKRMKHAPFLQENQMYLPVADAAEALQLADYTDPDTGKRYFTPGGGDWEIPEKHRVAILEYHAVSNNLWGIEALFVNPADMEAELVYLLENGYDPIWFEDLRYVEQYDKPVILTFDDGYDDNYLELLPILQKYQVKATVFVIVNAMGNKHTMSPEQVQELSDSGLVSVQSHGMSHHDMSVMEEAELRYELGDSQKVLTQLTGKTPYVLSYPEGKYSERTLAVADEYYKFGTKQTAQAYNTSDSPLLAGRYDIPRDMRIEEYAAILQEVFPDES